MNFLGDLERAFASAVYPNRVPIGIVVLASIAGVALIARRRRWDLAARRRPLRTLGGVVIAAAVAGPLVWYLASPLFLSSSIDEPPPVAASETRQSQSAPTQTGDPTLPRSAAPAPTDPALSASAAVTLTGRSGPFAGADEFHFGRGLARLIETTPGVFTVRLEQFAVRNGPDLYVYLSPLADGYATDAVELGRLKADQGNQNYRVPEGADVAQAQSVVIWCKQFGVVFATAPLE